MSKRQILAVAGVLIIEIFLPRRTYAQVGLVDPRKTEYVCVLSRTQLFAENGKNIVLVLPCEAANVRQDILNDTDYAALEKLQLERILSKVLKTRPNSEAEAKSTRADFLKFAREVCERHPKIALLPLDWKAEQARLSEITDEGGVALKACGALP
jgi:hypothetical protein